jgi:hypothetical protein
VNFDSAANDGRPMPELDRALGIRAYTNLSHTPEQRTDTDIRWYREAVEALQVKLGSRHRTGRIARFAAQIRNTDGDASGGSDRNGWFWVIPDLPGL